jgi:hypothetical protein
MWELLHGTVGGDFQIISPKILCDDDLVRTRSRIVRLFLTQTDGDKLLLVDSDIEAKSQVLRGMVEADQDCIGATYPKKRINPYGKSVDFALNVKKHTAIESDRASVDAIGCGFMLLSRELLSAMVEDYDGELGADDGGQRTTMIFMLKFSEVETDGRRHLLPEDYSFCSRVKEYTDVWLYTGVGAPLAHEGHHIFRGRAEDVHPRERPDIEYTDESGVPRPWGYDRP